jgi:hypothetical protein
LNALMAVIGKNCGCACSYAIVINVKFVIKYV